MKGNSNISKTDIQTPLVRIHLFLETKSYMENHLGTDNAGQFTKIDRSRRYFNIDLKGQWKIHKSFKLATLTFCPHVLLPQKYVNQMVLLGYLQFVLKLVKDSLDHD